MHLYIYYFTTTYCLSIVVKCTTTEAKMDNSSGPAES
jgi:hypothetical protein